MKCECKIFEDIPNSHEWDFIIRKAAAFVSEISPERLITITTQQTQTRDSGKRSVIVWYWVD